MAQTCDDYDPNRRFADTTGGRSVPLLFMAPSLYVQSPGAVGRLGEFLADLAGTGTRVGVVITPGRRKALMETVSGSLRAAGLKHTDVTFAGESSLREVERVTGVFQAASIDLVVGIGGGKCLDTARMAANRLGVRVVTVPTTASTDAPTAAVSVIYHDDGVFDRVEFSRTNPLLVVADETVLADAPPRYLAAGMGDAFSTWFEARCCMDNPAARTGRGARPTQGALAIAAQCREQLLAHGPAALAELRAGAPGAAFSRIVEANILLSGLGFESGGLAGAHAVAQGLTACPGLHRDFLHGELVAVGVTAHLLLEERPGEAAAARDFLRSVGLPVHLGDLGFDPGARAGEFDVVVEAILRVPFILAEPMAVSAGMMRSALLRALSF
ncbi:MAG: glycerol dehydrogenase [Acidobacteria bacterium]|nr:glycerol dehydrogenase [Acidobacteriota bacterium]